MNVKKGRAIISIGAEAKDVDKGTRAAEKKLKGFGKSAKKILKGGLGLAKSGLGMLGTGLGIQAAGGLVEMGADIMDVEKQLARFQIAGEVSNTTMADFRDQLMKVSNATGVSRNELVKGAQAYVSLTGDAKGAIAATQLFAEVAAGTGASMDDVSATAAALKQNLKIDPKDFRKAFDVLVKQGKIGAIEIKDLASKMANIAPQFSTFAGARSVEGMSELGAMLQVAKQGFGSADEAATGFNGMMTQINRNQKKLKKFKINVVDPKTGKFKNLLQIVKEIGANKDLMKPGALLDVLGEEKAVRAMSVLIENLRTVDQIKRDSLNSDQVAKDNLAFQASTAGKLQRSFESLKNAVAEAFTPERIEAFVALLGKMLGLIKTAAELVDHIAKPVDAKRDFAGAERESAKGKTIAEKAAIADRLEREGAQGLARRHGGQMGKINMADAMPDEFNAANRELIEELRAADPWRAKQQQSNAFIPQAPVDAKAIGSAVANAFAKNPIVVKLGAAAVSKEMGKSPAHRQPGKR
jgi:TP901 family phage tail tape measure protein